MRGTLSGYIKKAIGERDVQWVDQEGNWSHQAIFLQCGCEEVSVVVK